MSFAPSVSVPSTSSSGAVVGPWVCRACGHTNAFSVTKLVATVSVPCPQCGAFQTAARGQATSPPAPAAAAIAPIALATSSASVQSAVSIPSVVSSAPLSLDPVSAVERFRSFLRLPTVANEGNVNGANQAAVEFLRQIGENAGLRSQVYEYAENKPILVLTLEGQDPSLKSILLNSHYDVVPTMRSHWSVDPFAAEMTPEGDILGRGTQDMKCVCMQYLEAMHVLIRRSQEGRPFLRTVHLAFQPDEETGGQWGMQEWVKTPEFRALNVAFALDEGIANPLDEYTVFYGERGVWWMTVKAEGPTGHASRFIQNPATMKLLRSVQHFLDYRDLQEAKLLGGHASHSGECAHARSHALELGDVITLNLTVLKAGVTVDGGKTHSFNVVPMEAEAGFDIRLPPHVDVGQFEEMVKEWTKEDGLSYTVRRFNAEHVTQIDGERNPFWSTFKTTLEGHGQGTTKVSPQIFPAGTDSRFLRAAGIPVIGFSPIRLTPVLLHDHNERLHRDIFLEGIRVYTELIPALANQPTEISNKEGVYAQEKQPLERLEDKTAVAAPAEAVESAGDAAVPAQTEEEEEEEEDDTTPAGSLRSVVMLHISPLDAETDLLAIASRIKSEVVRDSLVWGEHDLSPIAYQLNRLRISCVFEDDKVNVNDLVELIETFEGVQSAAIATYTTISPAASS